MSLFLDFEQPIAELQAQIDVFCHVSELYSAVVLSEELITTHSFKDLP